MSESYAARQTLNHWILGALAFLAFALRFDHVDAAQPNILIIMADDLGYGDVSCNGATSIQTPNIDSLAKSGARFTNGYCSAATCTPTRFSLLTGTYAFRQKGTGVAPPNSPALIQAGTVTLPSLLKKANYRTAVIGKWHLGLGPASGPNWNGDLRPGPNDIGFDYSYILPTTNDRVPQVFVRNSRVVGLDANDPLSVTDTKPSDDHPTGETHRHLLKMDWSHGHNQAIHNGVGRIGFYTGGNQARFRDEDLADAWITDAKKRIEETSTNPFFLFFSSHDIHVPRVVHERFAGQSKLGPRGDAILEFDWSVGELLKCLESTCKRNDTLVILCSDNGPVLDDGYKDDAIEKLGDHKPAGPFQGGKYNIFEGGTRVPFLVSWPGVVPTGAVSDQVVCTIDFAASMASLANVPIPKDACLDSTNVLDALLAKPNAHGRESLLQQDNGSSGNFALREGNWKLLRHASGGSFNAHLRLVQTPQKRLQLFDLNTDPAESHDLSETYPDIAERLDAELTKIINDGRTRF